MNCSIEESLRSWFSRELARCLKPPLVQIFHLWLKQDLFYQVPDIYGFCPLLLKTMGKLQCSGIINKIEVNNDWTNVAQPALFIKSAFYPGNWSAILSIKGSSCALVSFLIERARPTTSWISQGKFVCTARSCSEHWIGETLLFWMLVLSPVAVPHTVVEHHPPNASLWQLGKGTGPHHRHTGKHGDEYFV